jgi:hypothetical protein
VISFKRVALAAACLFALTAAPAGAAYYPSGPQKFVPVTALEGWKLCFHDLYGDGTSAIADIRTQCDGDPLLLAGGPTGNPTLTVLAAAPRADVFFNTGQSDTPHNANGSGWYFSNDYSWGFAKQGDPIQRDSCDILGATGYPPGPNGNLRLCWHTDTGVLDGGWRAGTTGDLFDAGYTRYIFEPAPKIPLVSPGTCAADIALGKLKRNRKKGTARLPVEVPGPGELTGSGKGLKMVKRTATGAGAVDLPVKPKGSKRRKLDSAGKVKVSENVTFTAACGATDQEVEKLKLRKRLG